MRESTRARSVTWGAVGLLLLVGAVQVDLWPLTSYRLFSGVRTRQEMDPDTLRWRDVESRTLVEVDL